VALWAQALKDAVARASLAAEHDAALRAVAARAAGGAGAGDAGDSRAVGDALVAAEQALAWIDAEQVRLTEQRFAMGDAQALRQRLTGDPKRQLDGITNLIKQKLANERSEWTRRVQKQQHDVLDTVDRELRSASFETTTAGGVARVGVADAWRASFFPWLEQTLTTWGNHVAELVRTKALACVEPELRQLGAVLDEPLAPPWLAGQAIDGGGTRLEMPPLSDEGEVPTVVEAFLETFKSGLNTVAMLAGLVVIPVVGNFTTEQPTALRAVVMTGMLAPILAFAVIQTRGQRKKLISKSGERSAEKLKKAIDIYSRTRVDRFAKDAERHAQAWVQQASNDLVSAIDTAVARFLTQKEAAMAGELARAQLQAERLGDQLAALKQSRSALVNGALPELRRLASGSAARHGA
jgi:hypothetical protein